MHNDTNDNEEYFEEHDDQEEEKVAQQNQPNMIDNQEEDQFKDVNPLVFLYSDEFKEARETKQKLKKKQDNEQRKDKIIKPVHIEDEL